MFQLDDNFLKDVGLGDLPDDQKKPFLQHIYSELEVRVGQKLSDGMSDEQLEEFGNIIDRDNKIVSSWIEGHVPGYYNDEVFLKLQEATGLDTNDPNLRAEYAATKWLEINRPDYRTVVAGVMEDLKREVISNRDMILGKA